MDPSPTSPSRCGTPPFRAPGVCGTETSVFQKASGKPEGSKTRRSHDATPVGPYTRRVLTYRPSPDSSQVLNLKTESDMFRYDRDSGELPVQNPWHPRSALGTRIQISKSPHGPFQPHARASPTHASLTPAITHHPPHSHQRHPQRRRVQARRHLLRLPQGQTHERGQAPRRPKAHGRHLRQDTSDGQQV